MSVYTTVTDQALESLASQYDIGSIISLQGIQDGIENSNYYLSTSQGEYVLTLFETMPIADIPFCMRLMNYLAQHDVPCAKPLATKNDCYVVELMGKPTSIVERLQGQSISQVTVKQIEALGIALGRWHRVTEEAQGRRGFGQQRDNRYDKRWRQRVAKKLLPLLPDQDRRLLQQEIDLQRLYSHSDLPRGVIHSDLFRDNALFVGSRLNGIVDLYDACTGPLLYDLVVVVNDWCRHQDGAINVALAQKLLVSYQTQRGLNSLERGAWPIMLRAAALRFWLSRLEVDNQPRTAKLRTRKDPQQYKNILQFCILEEPMLTELWGTISSH